MNALLRRTLPTAAAGLVLLAAGSWLLAQPADRDADRPPPPTTDEGSMTHDAFDDRAPDADPRRDRGDRRGREARGFQERMEQLGVHLDEVMQVLEDIDPAMAERLRRVPERRPAMRMMIVRDRFPEALRLTRLRHDDPEMYELRVRDLVLYRRSQTLAREIQAARQTELDDDVADDLTETLEDTVEEHFELQQEIRELELDRLEARIDTLKDALDDRDRRKDELIAQRVQRLLAAPRSDRRPERDHDEGRHPGRDRHGPRD